MADAQVSKIHIAQKVGKKVRTCLSTVNSWRTKAGVICASPQENDPTGIAV